MTTVAPMSTWDFELFADWLRRRSAISLQRGKEYLVEARLTPLAARVGLRGTAEVISAVTAPLADPALVTAVIEAMTTNETSFFRDVTSFDVLRDHVLPDMVKRREDTRRLSVWSAASSTGQELYTIAMTLDRHVPSLASWDLTLLGTDLSTDVVRRARQGRYSMLEVNRGLPAHLLVVYFDQDGRDYVVTPALRDRCRFRQMNLAEPWPALPRFDIVFLRNVLIYFDPPVRERILAGVASVLAPDGYLFLGPAEASQGVPMAFRQERLGQSLVYRPLGAPEGVAS